MSDNQKNIKFDPNKPLQVGGQAVIEGVMMRGPKKIATAVRRSNGDVLVRKREYKSLGEKYKFFKLPILRGAAGLVEMMFIGIETLNFSAEIAMHDLDEKERNNGGTVKKKKSASNLRLSLTVIFALLMGVAIFFITPLFITTKLFDVEQDAFWFNIIAGGIRLSILLLYLLGISLMKDVKRLFEYHGGEHKAVMSFESSKEITLESAKYSSRFHPRCGTSFILIVALASMLLFSVIDSFLILWLGKLTLPIRLMTHLPLVPLVGGVSYEFIRWSSKKTDTFIGRILVAPGLWMQRITTKEPNQEQLEVALIALRAALDLDEVKPVKYIQNVSELIAK
ncbi:MAG: DUF1385 domain-containing protein [Ignavibacteriales bacterium]|nr:DUF1385 domain-containing protein [Ignavibacteriales bacterium]